MKKLIPVLIAIFTIAACNDNAGSNTKNAVPDSTGTHTHADGSTHADHDTTKPAQESFTLADTLKTDSSPKKEHTHPGGRKHSH
jgi:hypothetical protein